MDEWITRVMAELGITERPDAEQILDVARDAAHGVARPAAPITTYLMGMAVAQGMDPREAAQRIARLASQWGSPDEAGSPADTSPN